MSSGLFRDKSLEKISSPEQINDYIKTSNPSIWVMLFAIIILLAGGFIWAVFGELEITGDAVTICENGRAVCYISEGEAEGISGIIHINGGDYVLEGMSALPKPVEGMISPYGLHIAGFNDDEWVYTAEIDAGLPDGVYKTKVVIDNISPISLLMN